MRRILSAAGTACLPVIAGLAFCAAASADAQVPAAAPDTQQVVGLFETCMRFAGNAAELRDWIGEQHLPAVPGPQASVFLGGIGSGQVFGAATATGKHALVSYDNGTCQVVAMSGSLESVRQTLVASLVRQGVTVTPDPERTKPRGAPAQHMIRADSGPKHWLLSLGSRPGADAPHGPPELHLVASVRKDIPIPVR